MSKLTHKKQYIHGLIGVNCNEKYILDAISENSNVTYYESLNICLSL